MGHNIEYYDYAEKANKNTIQKDLDNYVSHRTWQEGGHGLEKIRWNDVVCESYDAAKEWIEKHDKGWYEQLAVAYKAPVRGYEDSDKIRELNAKIAEARKLFMSRDDVLYPKTRTSEFIGCSACGSRLASKLLVSNKCPVCHSDLRPETMLKSIEAARAKYSKALKTKEEYVLKHTKKEIRWLVKIEYHT